MVDMFSFCLVGFASLNPTYGASKLKNNAAGRVCPNRYAKKDPYSEATDYKAAPGSVRWPICLWAASRNGPKVPASRADSGIAPQFRHCSAR